MLDKKIYRYTNVELLDILKNYQDKSLVEKAKIELEERNLSTKQHEQLALDYQIYIDLKHSRKNEPLKEDEWITFFFLPFFTPKPKGREDHFSESEIERFQSYGFEKKLKQAKKVRAYGYLFWFLTTLIIVSLFIIFKR